MIDMQSLVSIAFILFAIGGSLGQQVVQQFCYDRYCYRTDGELKNITSLKDAQAYCYENDSSSWLLEIYDFEQLKRLFVESYFTVPVILNSVGTVANEWISVTDGLLPSNFTVDESRGQDFLYLSISGGKLYFNGADDKITGYFICQVPGNCSNGYCYEVHLISDAWFNCELYCYTNGRSVGGNYGHLATFEGMTYDQISNLSFVKQLSQNSVYWIGYSKLVYTLQHSNVRSYIFASYNSFLFLTANRPNESYYVYFYVNNFKEKPVGDDQFKIICMIAIPETTLETGVTVTSTSATATVLNFDSSDQEIEFILLLILPILMWLGFITCFICCILPFCVNRYTRDKETTNSNLL